MSHSRSRETAEALFRLTQRPKNSENVDPPSDIQRKRDEVHTKTARLKELRLAKKATLRSAHEHP